MPTTQQYGYIFSSSSLQISADQEASSVFELISTAPVALEADFRNPRCERSQFQLQNHSSIPQCSHSAAVSARHNHLDCPSRAFHVTVRAAETWIRYGPRIFRTPPSEFGACVPLHMSFDVFSRLAIVPLSMISLQLRLSYNSATKRGINFQS